MAPRIVFAMYRPHQGKDAELRALIVRHMPALRKAKLVTGRTPMLMKAKDGTYIEVFEWVSEDSSRKAHEDPAVGAIWREMSAIATLGKLGDLVEAKDRFPNFAPMAVQRPKALQGQA